MEMLAYMGKVVGWVIFGGGCFLLVILLGAFTANIKDADSPAMPLLFWRKKKEE